MCHHCFRCLHFVSQIASSNIKRCMQICTLHPHLQRGALRFSLFPHTPSASPAPFPSEGVSTPLLIPHALGTYAPTKKHSSLPPNLETWLLCEALQAPNPRNDARTQAGCRSPQGAVQEHELLQQCHQGTRPRPSCETAPGQTLSPCLFKCLNPLEIITIFPLPLSHIPLISLPSQAGFNPKFTRELSKSRHTPKSNTRHKYSQCFLSCQIHYTSLL